MLDHAGLKTDEGHVGAVTLIQRFGSAANIDLQHCPNRGAGELKIIAAILERPVIRKILDHLGLEPQPPPKGGRARESMQDFAA